MLKQQKSSRLLKEMKKYRFIYFMLIPIILYYFVFSYYPLILGVVTSFQKTKMIGTPEWVGFANYATALSNPVYGEAFVNSLVMGVGTFLLQFPFGLAIALCLNEMRLKVTKSLVQSVTYIPNLLSWSVVGGVWLTMLSPTGLINSLMDFFTGGAWNNVIFMSEAQFAQPIMIISAAWKGAGYFAVLFLAAIVSIDPSIYEAASIDGSSRLHQMFTITIPNLVPTMKTITLLASMGILGNFDQVFIMGNSSIFSKVRTLMLLIYQDGIVNFKLGPATAAATLVLIVTMFVSFLTRRATNYDSSYD